MSDFAAPNPSPATLGSARTQTANGSAPAPHKKARSTANLSLRQQRVRAIWINAMLWTFQGWLAMFYAGAAFAKLTVPEEHLIILLGWPAHLPPIVVFILGLIESLLVIGMLAPILRIPQTQKILLASATALIVIQVLAALYHLTSLQAVHTLLNLALIAITSSILVYNRQRTALP